MADTQGLRRSPLVLLVQENDDARGVLKRALEYGGMIVVEARVAQEALATLQETPPDVIAVDVGPDVNALGVCRRLGRQSRTERVPIIAFAGGYSAGDGRQEAFKASGEVVPCQAETLIAEIRRVLPLAC